MRATVCCIIFAVPESEQKLPVSLFNLPGEKMLLCENNLLKMKCDALWFDSVVRNQCKSPMLWNRSGLQCA